MFKLSSKKIEQSRKQQAKNIAKKITRLFWISICVNISLVILTCLSWHYVNAKGWTVVFLGLIVLSIGVSIAILKKCFVVESTILSTGQRQIEALCHMMRHDGLTELPNRLYFQECLETLLENKKKLFLLVLSIEAFKAVNYNLGRKNGDQVLIEIAKRLKRFLKKEDFLARTGGDEFSIIFCSCQAKDKMLEIAQNIKNNIEKEFVLKNCRLQLDVNMGISCSVTSNFNLETLTEFADVALHYAEETRKKHIVMLSNNLLAQQKRRSKIVHELAFALKKKQFTLHYQPKFDLKTNKLTGMEVLLRWFHPELGQVSPEEFIPIAESTGVIIDIGDWVLREAISGFSRWRPFWQQYCFTLSVNLSARQLEESERLLIFKTHLDKNQVPAACIELEITETDVMHHVDTAQHLLEKLSQLGCKIAIDDFGTGQSSLNYLTRLPVGVLKVDRSFIEGLSKHENASIVLESMIHLGMNLELKVVLEGISDKKQHDYIVFLSEKADFKESIEVQGWYYCQELSYQDMTKWLGDYFDSGD